MSKLKTQLQQLANERNQPCVSISLNTHRTHPENAQDAIVLKNLLKEAENRLVEEFGKTPIADLLEKINQMEDAIDHQYNLDSLHIFLSNDTQEIIRSPWNTHENIVHISDSFAVRPVIKMYNRSENYLLLLLSQSGVHLYEALDDTIVHEIANEDFPFSENRHYTTHSDKRSDSKYMDDLLREFFNKVDKAVLKVQHDTGMDVVVICTEDNYSHLMHVADKASVYHGYAPINYNHIAPHQIAKQGWELISNLQRQRRSEAIAEMKQAVAHGTVLTDLQEIYQAALDGRGDLLIVHQDFMQPVLMQDDRSFKLVDDVTAPDVIDDITSNIAWEVLEKKGRVVFTHQDEIKQLGNIALKTRY